MNGLLRLRRECEKVRKALVRIREACKALENLDIRDDNFKINFQQILTQVVPISFALERGGRGFVDTVTIIKFYKIWGTYL
jgi:hypothetical protein